MSVMVLVEVAIKPEVADGYAQRLAEPLAQTRAYPGCESIVAYRSPDRPEEFVVVERWASREHYQRYTEWRRAQGTFERLAAISLRPMSVRYFDAIA